MFYGYKELRRLKEGNDPNFNYPGLIFVSLPMADKEEKYIKMRMNEIFNKFIDAMNPLYKDIKPVLIDSYSKVVPVKSKQNIWCLGDSITLMSTSDMVIFAKDYSMARGCCAEFDICRAYPEMNYTFEDFLEGGMI